MGAIASIEKSLYVLLNGLLLFADAGVASAAPDAALPSTNVVFVLYDAGETKAMLPVADYLGRHRIPYKLLAAATARSLLAGRDDLLDPNRDCHIKSDVNQTTWRREQALPEGDVALIRDCIRPDIVVAGMVSVFGEQALIALVGKNPRTDNAWGYFDALSPQAVASVTSPRFISALSRVLVPSKPIALAFKRLNPAPRRVEVVGQPTLEAWRLAAKNIDPAAMRERLGITGKRPMILYAGGYGEDYEESFRLFVSEAVKLDGFDVLVSLHPKVDGSLERRVIADMGGRQIRILPKDIPTMEAAVPADVVVTQRSTVGVQALFMGRSVIYLDSKPGYYDVGIENGWATQIIGEGKFAAAVRRLFRNNRSARPANIYNQAGIPQNSAELIGKMIEARLRHGY